MRKNLFLALLGLILFVGCKKDKIEEEVLKDYGNTGTHKVATFSESDYAFSTIYYPKDIATMSEPSPLVFFASGWFSAGSQPSTKYETLFQYMASQGYTVIYTDEGQKTNAQFSIDHYNKIMDAAFAKDNILKYVDETKIGVVGHSAGGGIAFRILDYYSKEKGYGAKGRFIMALDPWYAFEMSESAMKSLPSNTNVVIMKYGEGGNNSLDGTDARIPLTEYSLLESIPAKNKDYRIFVDADHHYPYKTDCKEGLLAPLGALMDYTFYNQSELVRKAALENGSDNPYNGGNGIQVVLDSYQYPCDGANTLIDYCSIVP